MIESGKKPWRGPNVGTANLVSAEQDERGEVVLRLRRNAFVGVPVDESTKSMLRRQRVPFVVQGRRMYVLGDSAFNLACAVDRDAHHPMRDDRTSSKVSAALPVLNSLNGTIQGETSVQEETCFSSVPGDPSVVPHDDLFDAVVRVMRYKPSHIIEGHAIDFQEPAEEDFAGIGIFCGGGLSDICVAYKSLPALFFSTARGGEWVDINVANALGVKPAKTQVIHRNGLALMKPGHREEDEIALYYRNLINSTLNNIKERYPPAYDRCGFPDPISIVFSGGTSMAGNFIELVHAIYKEMETPRPCSIDPSLEASVRELREADLRLEAEPIAEGLDGNVASRILDFRRYSTAPGRGLDVGTSNIVGCVRQNEGGSLYNLQRNAFLEVRSDVFTQKMFMKLDVDRVVRGAKGFVIGNSAFDLANVFEKNTRRPMRDGMISPTEPDALFVEHLVISSVLGKPQVEGEVSAFSIPADPIDMERNAVYHSDAIEAVLRGLGYSPRPVLEGQAVVFAELGEEDYTGIGISCGGGMFNICIAYKSLPALAFSTSRGGDWIDNNVAQSLGLTSSQVCSIKENGIDLNRPRDRVEEAICIYYRNLVHYTVETIRERFESAQNMPAFRRPISVVCSGGTSLARGFIDVFRREFKTIDFPIEVKEIRRARDPLRTVALGCLEAALEETRARTGAPTPTNTVRRADISKTIAVPARPTAGAAPAFPHIGSSSTEPAGYPVSDKYDRARQVGGPACR